MPRALLTALISVAALAFLACGAQTGATPGGTPTPPHNSGSEPAIPPDAQEAVVAAKSDLAGRTGKHAEQITVVSVERQEWRDTSLGCPKPGMFYAQVITPGYRIVLSDGAAQYEYHSDTRGHVVSCDANR